MVAIGYLLDGCGIGYIEDMSVSHCKDFRPHMTFAFTTLHPSARAFQASGSSMVDPSDPPCFDSLDPTG
jgi:hypothetical protein